MVIPHFMVVVLISRDKSKEVSLSNSLVYGLTSSRIFSSEILCSFMNDTSLA